MSLLSDSSNSGFRLSKHVPSFIKNMCKLYYSPFDHHKLNWMNVYNKVIKNTKRSDSAIDAKVCIINDVMMRYVLYEAACLEYGVPYDIVDISDNAWLDKIRNKAYDVIFFRPFVLSSYRKRIFDDCSFLMSNVMGENLFPSFNDLWIYESKIRCLLMLKYHEVPHPESSYFFEKAAALDFIETVDLPVVFKTDIGSDASGVVIADSREQCRKLVEKCFGSGFVNYNFDPHDRQRGYVLFQKFIEGAREWRVIRIGNSYFSYEKGRKGRFHSGSKIVLFSTPEIRLLEFVRSATDKVGTDCMSVDVFEDTQGNYCVNELQTYYGANDPGGYYFENGEEIILKDGETHELRVNGKAGRYYYSNGEWLFEEGDFARNAGCNLRVQLAFQKLGRPLTDLKV